MEALAEFGRRKPIFGTCAGAILMATEVCHPAQESLALMDIAVERNAYGRQIDSRVTVLDPEPEFRAAHRARQARGGVHSRAGHPARRRRRRRCWRAMPAIPCWWSRAATWWPRSIPS